MKHPNWPDNPSVGEWSATYRSVPADIAAQVDGLVDANLVALAVAFYRDLLAEPGVAQWIPGDTLNSRLLPSIQRWMQFLFDPVNSSSPSATIALQRHVGEMHARARIPVGLVSKAFRSFKRDINAVLTQSTMSPEQKVQALAYAGELSDLALAEMLGAHNGCLTRPTFADLGAAMPLPDLSAPAAVEAERHQQLGALSEEENRFLRSMLSNIGANDVQPLGSSPFGLWLNHKAPMLFGDASETAALKHISQTLDHLDASVLPRLQAGLGRSQVPAKGFEPLLREVVGGLEDVRSVVNSLFDQLAGEDGHLDTLTQLFNRPLLDSILQREIELARRKRTTFSMVLVDIDNFSLVNQTYGHELGNRVLQQVASLLAKQVRSSDFVFRYGGEEFLIMLVELDGEQSMAVAEKIRSAVASADFLLTEERSVQFTLSVGVVLCDGQTDPQGITGQAESAMHHAKNSGRNRVVMLPAGVPSFQ